MEPGGAAAIDLPRVIENGKSLRNALDRHLKTDFMMTSVSFSIASITLDPENEIDEKNPHLWLHSDPFAVTYLVRTAPWIRMTETA